MKLFFASLGCDKNLVDSEHMLSRLAADGYTITDDEYEADLIVVNTCCFIRDAMEESIQSIIDYGALKKNGHLKGLIVTGCLAQRFADEIRKELPEADVILGTNSYDEISAAVKDLFQGKKDTVLKPLTGLCDDSTGRLLTTGGHFAYMKIAEGCSKNCSYCVIPSVRGAYRSVPMESLLKEAERLAEDGVRELILIAQETTLYGVDLYGRKKLPELIEKLSRIEGIRWIRLMYCYPEEITDELVETIRTNPKVCHYLDIPIQHCSDEILRRMNRRTNRASLEALITKLRDAIPDICLRTTMICGFPGETEEQHRELLSFIGQMKFDHLGAFPYSREDNTPAASMPDQIPDEIKNRRYDEIMTLQQKLSAEKNQSFVGKHLTAAVVGYLPDDDVYVARTYRDAPQVDGMLFTESDEALSSGDFIDVLVTGSSEYDLTGVLQNELTE